MDLQALRVEGLHGLQELELHLHRLVPCRLHGHPADVQLIRLPGVLNQLGKGHIDLGEGAHLVEHLVGSDLDLFVHLHDGLAGPTLVHHGEGVCL